MAYRLDETPGQPGEWGFRPAEGSTTEETPPGFVWRPQEGAVHYDLQCTREAGFSRVDYEGTGLTYMVHRPSKVFEPGEWFWRFRAHRKDGQVSEWSQPRGFVIDAQARALALPEREELIGRIPKGHPRLFVRPENLEDLRKRAQGDLKPIYEDLVATAEDILNDPPPTEEPPLYPEGTVRLSEPWREIWWGNRMYTIAALNSAATLGFTRLLGGQETYGQLARELLMACAEWDPLGATGYRYNDEAGMPYNYYFCRTYSFIHDLLSDAERETCRKVMLVQGTEMYDHLVRKSQYLWHPYNSHSGRAWHFLGEIGVTFLDEIPEAEEWVWFAMNVFGAVYPAWCDEDGGWHQGLGYWASYVQRFTWWADIMREAMGINAYDKPYFARAGDFPMYFQPPGTLGGGVADLTTTRRSDQNCELMAILAAQAQNPSWQWYVDAHQKAEDRSETEQEARDRRCSAVGAGRSLYIDFVRGALPKVSAKIPMDLPGSKCFRGTGLAVLNSDLMDAKNNVEVIFKSSPFGSQSHGFDAQNSFSLFAFGERLLIHTGQRDIHGSDHHRNWMHETKSTNSIGVNGLGQGKNTAAARGEILDFQTSATFDYVSGEAGPAYEGRVDRFTRRILFVKPEVVVIFDSLETSEPATFQWYLHAPTEMQIEGSHVQVVNGQAACEVSFLQPGEMAIGQTDKFDPPPRERIQLAEYHLTAETMNSVDRQIFMTVLQPHRVGDAPGGEPELTLVGDGFAVSVPLLKGRVEVLMQGTGGQDVSHNGVRTNGEVGAVLFDGEGKVMDTFVVGGTVVKAG